MLEINNFKEKERKAITQFLQWEDRNGWYTDENSDIEGVIPEFVDKILCSNGEVYTNSLILCNNDYAISLLIPIKLTPQNLKDYMIV